VVTQALHCPSRALFCSLAAAKLTTEPGLSPWLVFAPFWLAPALHAGARWHEMARAGLVPARVTPLARSLRERPFAVARFGARLLCAAVRDGALLLCVAFPVAVKLDGGGQTWAVALTGVWLCLGVLNLAILLCFLFAVHQGVRGARAGGAGGGSGTCMPLLLGAMVGASVVVPLTIALAYGSELLAMNDNGNATTGPGAAAVNNKHANSVKIDAIFDPGLTGCAILAFMLSPAGAFGAVHERRSLAAIWLAGGDVSAEGQGARGGGGGGGGGGTAEWLARQRGRDTGPRHALTEHSLAAELRKAGSSLYQLVGDAGAGAGGAGAGAAGARDSGGSGGSGGGISEGTMVVLDDVRVAVGGDGWDGGAAGGECVICMDAPRGAFVLLPCGHADLCMACAKTVAQGKARCPICRTKIEEARRLGALRTLADGTVVASSAGGFTVRQL
jgi:hypothetical protein